MQIKAAKTSGHGSQIKTLTIILLTLIACAIVIRVVRDVKYAKDVPRVIDKRQSELLEFTEIQDVISAFPEATILLAVKDEASGKLGAELRSYFRSLGADHLSDLRWRESYVGILQDGQIVQEQSSTDSVVSIAAADLRATSAGMDHGNSAQFYVQDRVYDMAGRGLHIAIIAEGKLLATYSWDYYASASPDPTVKLYGVMYADVPRLTLRVSQQAYDKLRAKRDAALETGVLLTEDTDMVEAQLVDGDQSMPAQIRLKGDWVDHLYDDTWSWRVELLDDMTWSRMHKFSLQHPSTRNYLSEWLLHQVLDDQDILHLQYHFVQLTLEIGDGLSKNKKYLGAYAVEEFFTRELMESNQRREGILLKLDEDPIWRRRAGFLEQGLPWGEIEGAQQYARDELEVLTYGQGQISKDSALMQQQLIALGLLRDYMAGDRLISEVMDVNRLAMCNAILNLMGADHALVPHNYRFYYNPITSRLEPVGFDGDSGRKISYPYQYKHAALDSLYLAAYASAIEEVTSDDFIYKLKHWTGLTDHQAMLESAFPDYKYDDAYIDYNRNILRSLVQPYAPLRVYVSNEDASGVELTVSNHGRLPVVLQSLRHSDRLIARSMKPYYLRAGERQVLRMEYVEDYERSFVTKSGKLSFDLRQDVDGIHLQYQIPGSLQSSKSPIRLWTDDTKSQLDETRTFKLQSTVSDFPFLQVDQQKRVITCAPSHYQVSDMMVIPPDYTFVVPAGTSFEMTTNSAYIFSHSPLDWRGTSTQPIRVYTAGVRGRGVMVSEAADTSYLSYVKFEQIRNPALSAWSVSGAVNFYESDVVLDHCIWDRTRCEDALNVIRSNFSLEDCLFLEVQSDAFDGDFVQGAIRRCRFEVPGNDAIDISGSEITVSDTEITGAGDKALSAGEDSKMSAERILISDCEIGVASKDLSHIDISELSLKNLPLGFTAFRKKASYGPASITAVNVQSEKIQTMHLIEEGSRLRLDGTLAETQSRVKDQMYGVIYGKKSQ